MADCTALSHQSHGRDLLQMEIDLGQAFSRILQWLAFTYLACKMDLTEVHTYWGSEN